MSETPFSFVYPTKEHWSSGGPALTRQDLGDERRRTGRISSSWKGGFFAEFLGCDLSDPAVGRIGGRSDTASG